MDIPPLDMAACSSWLAFCDGLVRRAASEFAAAVWTGFIELAVPTHPTERAPVVAGIDDNSLVRKGHAASLTTALCLGHLGTPMSHTALRSGFAVSSPSDAVRCAVALQAHLMRSSIHRRAYCHPSRHRDLVAKVTCYATNVPSCYTTLKSVLNAFRYSDGDVPIWRRK